MVRRRSRAASSFLSRAAQTAAARPASISAGLDGRRERRVRNDQAALERSSKRIEDFDAAIAAHALAVGGTLVTANVDPMTRVPGLTVEDWTADHSSGMPQSSAEVHERLIRALRLALVGPAAYVAADAEYERERLPMRPSRPIEIHCDGRALRSAGSACAYGLMLLAVGEQYATTLAVSTPLFEPSAHLEARIDAMTTSRRKHSVAVGLQFATIAIPLMVTAAWTGLPLSVSRGIAPRSDGNRGEHALDRSRVGAAALTIAGADTPWTAHAVGRASH